MSPPKMNRKLQCEPGKSFPERLSEIRHASFAQVIAGALRREFGDTHAAIKTVVALTKTNERAVKNWFAAKNGPTGQHLVDLVRTSDEVLEVVLILSQRHDLILAKKLGDSKKVLATMLKLMGDLQSIH